MSRSSIAIAAVLAVMTPVWFAAAQTAEGDAAAKNGGQAAEITVDVPAPDVTVEIPAPTVTVEQQAPVVTVVPPEPDVTVEQRQPDVTVSRSEPEASVEPKEPKVSVDQVAATETRGEAGEQASDAGAAGEGQKAEAPMQVAQTESATEEAAPAGDLDAGKKVFNKCRACHKVEEGAGHGVGPNLHGVFGREAAAAEGFNYSKALAETDIVWNVENLSKYLENPRSFIPGNKMAFPGIRSEEDRQNVIAYLHQISE